MKKVTLLFALFISCTNIFGQLGYRYGSSFIELYPMNSSLYFVQTKNSEQMMKLKEIVTNSKGGEKIIANLAENAIIVNSKSLGASNYISDIYQDKAGFKLIILPRLAIKMKAGYDIDEVLNLYGQHLSFDKKEKNVYKVNCNLDNAEAVLAINKDINLMEPVEWCEPMMIGEGRKCSDFTNYQYYIKNTGQNGGTTGIDINVVPVWNILPTDTSLVVAVLDDGVERDHEDLSGIVLNGKTIDYPNEYGDPINDFYYYDGGLKHENKSHGTACAGIIAAKDNNIGIKGVASGVKILPINIYPYPFSLDLLPVIWFEKVGQAITWACDTMEADIISCSWSFSYSSYIENALTNAMNNGRNGKGTIVICSAGNKIPADSVRFPANMTGTIAVGAIDNTGNIWDYSCRGSSLDLVAPSGDGNSYSDIITTDRTGDSGYNPPKPPTGNNTDLTNTNYTQRFNGTSAACPQVAGVVALMLSANPYLTVGDVKSVLQNTARKLPGMNGQNRTDAYGYGLVDAYAAVQAVTTSKIVGPKLINSTGHYHINFLASSLTVSWSLSDNYYNNGYNLLIPNYPTTGHCLIVRDQSHNLMNDTLIATIKYNGNTIQTLKKDSLYAYDDFWGQYTSGNLSSNINYTHYFYVKKGVTTNIFSPNFLEATVSYDSSATIPSNWDFSPANGTLAFFVPSNSSSTPVVIIVNDGCGNSYQLYAAPTSMYIFNISNDDNSITITLNENDDSERGLSIDQPWTVEVLNATTGVQMASLSSTNRSVSISTSGWPKGIYIVKVTIGKEVYTEKVIVK